jgi:hypothetical protein
VHFIAHAVRDIADRLAFVLDSQQAPRRVQYENEMDRIEKLWPRLPIVGNTTDGVTAQATLTIDYKLAGLINFLVVAHRERRERPSNYHLLFRCLMRNEPFGPNANERLVSDFKEVRDWFMGLTHLRQGKSPQVNESELQIQFTKFEGMLHSFVGDFFTGIAELDEILQQAND